MTFNEKDILSAASGALQDGLPSEALAQLSPLLAYPAALEGSLPWQQIFFLMERIYAHIGESEVAKRCRTAATDPMHADALYQLGTALVEQRLPQYAATVLSHAHTIFPEREDVLAELAAALELLGLYEKARQYLEHTKLDSFMIRYLRTFETLMMGDLEQAREQSKQVSAQTETEMFMRTRLDDIFTRVDMLQGVTPLDESDLRGWHYALTGSILLHLAPEGTGGDNGRYGYLEDTEALCLEGIRRLAHILDLWKLRIPRVLAFSNPDSQRLGKAVAGILGVKFRESLLPDNKGLFVVYDIDQVIPEIRMALRSHEPGKPLFVHATQWTKEQEIVGDFTTLLYDRIISPWNRHTIFPWRPDLPKGPPTETPGQIADRIVKASLPANAMDNLQPLLTLADAVRDNAAARKTKGVRSRLWIGGPVKSKPNNF